MVFQFLTFRRIACLLCLAAVIHLAACAPALGGTGGGAQTLTIGMEKTAVNTLIFIADSQGYFHKQGLNVEIVLYPSGVTAVDAVLKQEVDVATASEFVLVRRSFAGEPIRTWGSIDRFMHNYLIARKDRGIQAVQDLKGKKVGLPMQSAAEFYLGRFLELNGMNLKDVTPVNISPEDLVKAFADGEVDAVVAWQPNAETTAVQMGSGVIRWPVQSEQVTYGNLISTTKWIDAHPDGIQRFLFALLDAESFIANQPEDARALMQERLSYDDAFMSAIWQEHQFQVSLEQSMVLAMEDEARWMINNQLVSASQIPALADMIYTDGMKAVRPDTVNIIQ